MHLAKGHDGGKHDGTWSVEGPLKIEAIPVREVVRIRNCNMTHTALSMVFTSTMEGAELLCQRLNLFTDADLALPRSAPHPARVSHALTIAMMETEHQIERALKRGDQAGVAAWQESLRAIQAAADHHSEARNKQTW